LDPSQRGRGLAWFLTSDGTLDRRFTLQLPPSVTLVRWDDRPYVSPLVDVVDRGRPTGLVLVGAEAVRLLHWHAGLVTEPERSLYELELGDWRDYDAYVGHPGRSSGGMHVATFDQRVEDWRRRFLSDAASRTAREVTELGWHRMVVAGEQRVTDLFTGRLPEPVRDRIVAVVAANLLWEQPAAVAERVENALHDAWRREVHALVDGAVTTASAGGAAALGWADVLTSLVRHRVQHLAFAVDAAPDPQLLTAEIREALGSPSAALLVERAVEYAVTSGADITAVPEDLVSLLPAGGVVATLRY
jgi:hypothetical protein